MNLRPAALSDSEMLLQWRNDEATRSASFNTYPVERETHERWLESALSSPNIHLWIAEVDKVAVGTVRVVSLEDGAEISWTVSPNSRGLGYGTAMVRAGMERFGKPVFARIKQVNVASMRIAERCGMRRASDKGDENVSLWVYTTDQES